MGRVPWVLAVAVWTVLRGISGMEDSCMLADEDPYLLFGSRTAYTFAYNQKYARSKLHDVPGCRAIAIWMVARYGTQVPPADEFADYQHLETLKRNIVDNYKQGNYRDTGHRMCAADVEVLGRWSGSARLDESRAGHLTPEAARDTRLLAQAWRHKFPELFTNNKYDYLFKFGKEYSASKSFQAFTEGLFGEQPEAVDLPRDIDDSLFSAHRECPAWDSLADYNSTNSQLRIFESKAEYQMMISNVSRRLGFRYDVEARTVRAAYRACALHKALDVAAHSAWCTVFSKEDLQRLEYGEDLDAYYKFGYGSPLHEQLGCPLVNDLINFLDIQMQPHELPQQPRTRVHLTDYEGLLTTYAALGLMRDLTPLTGDNYHGSLIQKRQWRTSLMAPYNGNIAVVLYKCDPEPSEGSRAARFSALFLGNEQPLQMSECRVGLCDLAAPPGRARLRPRVCVAAAAYCSHAHADTTSLVWPLLALTLTLVA